MPELSRASVPGQAAVRAEAKLTVFEIDALLAGFRDWLVQIVSTSEAMGSPSPFPAQDGQPAAPDLHEFLGQLIALRHEVNLQTRATRSQQEQNAQTLTQLGEAVELLQKNEEQVEMPDPEASAETLRPLLKALVDAHDSLALARREIQRVQANLKPLLDDGNHVARQRTTTTLPGWARWLGMDRHLDRVHEEFRLAEEEQSRKHAANLQAVRRLVDSIIAGYAMSLQRLERTLEQHGLEPIPCVGEVFDPELMEVVEVVPEFGRAGSEVIEEVRRGYFWNGRIFRFAQVKIAKSTENQP